MQHNAWLKACAPFCRGLQSVTQLQAEEEHRANKASEISAGKQGDIEQLTVRTDSRLCFSHCALVRMGCVAWSWSVVGLAAACRGW